MFKWIKFVSTEKLLGLKVLNCFLKYFGIVAYLQEDKSPVTRTNKISFLENLFINQCFSYLIFGGASAKLIRSVIICAVFAKYVFTILVGLFKETGNCVSAIPEFISLASNV